MQLKVVSASMFLLILPAPLLAQAGTWVIDPNHTQADFQVRHMSMSTVRGSISNIKGNVVWDPKDASKDSVNVVLDATTVNTSSAYRDKDIKGADWFNVEKFPTLSFKSTSVTQVGKKLKIAGDLTLAGVTKPVVLEADEPSAAQKGMQGGLVSGLSASTTIKRTDFNFGTKYPNAMVSDEIKIEINAEIDQK